MIGIYKITNHHNNKVYIGQSQDIDTRFTQHKDALSRGKHENKQMQKDYIASPCAFSFTILEECYLSQLNEAEKRWIAYYKSDNKLYGYNQNKGGGYRHRKINGRPTCLLDELTNSGK